MCNKGRDVGLVHHPLKVNINIARDIVRKYFCISYDWSDSIPVLIMEARLHENQLSSQKICSEGDTKSTFKVPFSKLHVKSRTQTI